MFGFPSVSANWIAVIGRQSPNSSFESHEVITPSATLMSTAANSRKLSLICELVSGRQVTQRRTDQRECAPGDEPCGVGLFLCPDRARCRTDRLDLVEVVRVRLGRHGRRGPGRNWLGESSSSGLSLASHVIG